MNFIESVTTIALRLLQLMIPYQTQVKYRFGKLSLSRNHPTGVNQCTSYMRPLLQPAPAMPLLLRLPPQWLRWISSGDFPLSPGCCRHESFGPNSVWCKLREGSFSHSKQFELLSMAVIQLTVSIHTNSIRRGHWPSWARSTGVSFSRMEALHSRASRIHTPASTCHTTFGTWHSIRHSLAALRRRLRIARCCSFLVLLVLTLLQ
jgi:hypothetical protein